MFHEYKTYVKKKNVKFKKKKIIYHSIATFLQVNTHE